MLPLNTENTLKKESMLPTNISNGSLPEESNLLEKELNSLNKDVFPMLNLLLP